MNTSHETVITFWFEELTPTDWWMKNDQTDALITTRFLTTHNKAINGELDIWRKTPLGRLAEIIVLDQFSRNIYRNKPDAFAYDSMALSLSREMIDNHDDMMLTSTQQPFCYMPFMHSESRQVHEEAVILYSKLPNNLEFELKHKAIIDRFGRYPHRNDILGRPSTPEEIAFLQQPGSSF